MWHKPDAFMGNLELARRQMQTVTLNPYLVLPAGKLATNAIVRI